MAHFTYDTVLGQVTVEENDGEIVFCGFGQIEGKSVCKSTPLLEKAAAEIREYFAGFRKEFDLPLRPCGTPFQKMVWEELRKIPYGETKSYGQIAAAAGNPKACRAAGGANNKNPICILIPCHRVVGSNGSLTGYAYGTELKQKLLELEKNK